MIPYSEFILLYIILFSKDTADSSYCLTSFSDTDHVLTGHVIRTLNHKSFESCTFSCELEPQCFSVNYISSHKTCLLNDATKEYFPGDLVKQKGAFYMGMVTRSYDPCMSMRCENGGTCVRSPSLKCKCLKGYSGLHCESYDPCVSMRCENGGTCISKPTLKCKCRNGFTGIHCEALQALGMESGAILNGSIKASSKKTGFEPWEGRLNGNSCWMAAKNSNAEYITVRFVAQVTVVAIATQGAPIDSCWVESYVIRYGVQFAISQDPKVYQANSDKTSIVTNKFSSPLSAEWISIAPTSWFSCIALRLELYGY